MKREVINEVRNAVVGIGEVLDFAIDEKNSRCNILIVSGNRHLDNGGIYTPDEVSAELYACMIYFNSLKGIDTIIVKCNEQKHAYHGYSTINNIVEAIDPIIEAEVGHKHHFHFFNRKDERQDTDKVELSEKVTIFGRLSAYLNFEIQAGRLALRDKIMMMYIYYNLCKEVDRDKSYTEAKRKEFQFWTADKIYNFTRGKLETVLTTK